MTDDGKITLMIVDDHPMVRDGLEMMLSARRIFKIVKTVACGQEAVAYIRENGIPDVVISDVRMQGMDGFETLAKIRRFYPDARVLLLAGMPTVEEVERARKAGAASGSEVSAEGVVHNVSILSDGRVAFDVRGEAASRRFPQPKMI